MRSLITSTPQHRSLATSACAGPLVSILINNYNYGQFLREAIDSALNQTYRNIEIVVVDDGSTDNSREIIVSYGNRIVAILKENGGQASAFNAGFAACTGKWICLLDADDVWVPNKVEAVVKAAMWDPDATLIYHCVQPVSADLKKMGRSWPRRIFRGWISERLQRCGGSWAAPPTSALAVRADIFRATLPIPERECRICADAYIFQVIPFLGPVLGIKECLSWYRLHGSNHFNNQKRRESNRNLAMWQSIAIYETVVTATNCALQRVGIDSRVSLEDHLGYQIFRYKLRVPGRLSLLNLAWRIIVFPGEPSVITRYTSAAKLILCAVGLRP